MGAIKDIVDLTKDLESRAKDRRDMEIIHKIQSLAFALQSQHADVIERDVRLMEENAGIKRQLEKSQAEEIRFAQGIEFHKSKKTGGAWIAFCPKCQMPVVESSTEYVECNTNDCDWRGVQLSGKLADVARGFE